MSKIPRRISLMKSLSWRLIALSITFTVGFIATGSLAFAAGIGLADSAIKIIIYYLHERAWEQINAEVPKSDIRVGPIEVK